MTKIALRGTTCPFAPIASNKLASIRRTYRLHDDIERQLLWMGPMTDLPPKLG
ncbi:MAG: hypothetical protein ABSH09_36610 [Bryobacteraceae bacterium]